MNEGNLQIDKIPEWIGKFDDPSLKQRVLDTGYLTGWRKYPNGSFGGPNFERAIILDRLVRIIKPGAALEIGTGRGLGCLSMAQSADIYGVNLKISTIDILPPSVKQSWPIRLNGENKVVTASVEEIWNEHVDSGITRMIERLTGPTTSVLPQLVRQRKKYDLVFIDAGHDPFSVVHDLAFAIKLLAKDGVVLMDDFAPLDEYGLGACLAVPHARAWFKKVMVFHTEGLVYGGSQWPEFPRAMVLLSELVNSSDGPVSSLKLLWWRIVSFLVAKSYQPGVFPIK